MINIDWMQRRYLEGIIRMCIMEDVGDCPDNLPSVMLTELLLALEDFLKKNEPPRET